MCGMVPKCEELAEELNEPEIFEILPEPAFLTALNHVEQYIGRSSLYFEKVDGCHAGQRWPFLIGLVERSLSIPLLSTSPWSLKVSKGNFSGFSGQNRYLRPGINLI